MVTPGRGEGKHGLHGEAGGYDSGNSLLQKIEPSGGPEGTVLTPVSSGQSHSGRWGPACQVGAQREQWTVISTSQHHGGRRRAAWGCWGRHRASSDVRAGSLFPGHAASGQRRPLQSRWEACACRRWGREAFTAPHAGVEGQLPGQMALGAAGCWQVEGMQRAWGYTEARTPQQPSLWGQGGQTGQPGPAELDPRMPGRSGGVQGLEGDAVVVCREALLAPLDSPVHSGSLEPGSTLGKVCDQAERDRLLT